MSASMVTVATVVLHLAVSPEQFDTTNRDNPAYDDGTPHCRSLIASNKPCEWTTPGSALILWQRRHENWPDVSWEQQWGKRKLCEMHELGTRAHQRGECIPRHFIEYFLMAPRWVPSEHGGFKLQL